MSWSYSCWVLLPIVLFALLCLPATALAGPPPGSGIDLSVSLSPATLPTASPGGSATCTVSAAADISNFSSVDVQAKASMSFVADKTTYPMGDWQGLIPAATPAGPGITTGFFAASGVPDGSGGGLQVTVAPLPSGTVDDHPKNNTAKKHIRVDCTP